jgi:UDP-galactopyranose mutase
VRDLICYSHLRWAFVYQRPQHLMSRAAATRRVWFVEEPVTGPEARLHRSVTPEGVNVCVPQVPVGTEPAAVEPIVARLVGELAQAEGLRNATAWLYTPMMLPLAESLAPRFVVYDCMDELSAFRFAPAQMLERERALFARADVVFAGGRSLWEAKRGFHANLYLFPSSVDVGHFRAARGPLPEPAPLAPLRRPRLCWVGVVDERLDLDLLADAAALRPDWEWVLVGPTAKIDPATIPQAPNIHPMGPRPYPELPAWLAWFDVAIMPFAHNDATRYISPTKTPEFLAAGLPVVSTPVRDVVRDYGARGLVHIAAGPKRFVAACERALAERDDPARLCGVDEALAESSWDDTWARMSGLVDVTEARVRRGELVG